MSDYRSWPYRLTLVLSGVIVYACLNYATGASQILHFRSTGAYYRALLWTGCYVLFCVSFFSVLTLLRGWWLALFVGLSSLSGLINIIYVSIVGSRIDGDVVTWLVDQRAGLGNVYAEFPGKFILAGACVLGLAPCFFHGGLRFFESRISAVGGKTGLVAGGRRKRVPGHPSSGVLCTTGDACGRDQCPTARDCRLFLDGTGAGDGHGTSGSRDRRRQSSPDSRRKRTERLLRESARRFARRISPVLTTERPQRPSPAAAAAMHSFAGGLTRVGWQAGIMTPEVHLHLVLCQACRV